MQTKILSLLATLLAVGVPAAEAQTPQRCFDTETAVSCSSAADEAQIKEFLEGLGSRDVGTFVIENNPRIRALPAGLFAGVRFSEVVITGCPQLTRIDDIMGASSASVRSLRLIDNALQQMPALTASRLAKVKVIQPHPLTVGSDAFRGTPSVEDILFRTARVQPYAFQSLKNLKNLTIYEMPPGTVPKGAFHFGSPVLQKVQLVNDGRWKGEAEDGAYDGFPKGSTLKVVESTEITPGVYFNVLNGGANLEIPEPVHCGCNVAWIRFAPFVANAYVRCHTSMWPVEVQYTAEEDYKDC